jgi:tetratricopeptide (TPR) repeat protein
MLRLNRHCKGLQLRLAHFVAVFSLLAFVAAAKDAGTNAPEQISATPREFYNDGTRKLSEGKLRDAETSLQTAVASQNEKIQPAALYNLGEVRFRQGIQILTNAPDGDSTHAKSQHAKQTGDTALQAADEALAGDDINALVAAYLQGKGARKELKSAMEAVQKALDSYRNVLLKWQRSEGDFKGTVELKPSDTNAQRNVDVVDRNIALLVDLQRMMMQNAAGMGKQRSELRDKMNKMKKRLPGGEGDKLKGAGDDDDEDENGTPRGPEPGTKEGPSRDGTEQQMLSYEEAERLLSMLKLDSGRKLPMGMSDTEAQKPVFRKGHDW